MIARTAWQNWQITHDYTHLVNLALAGHRPFFYKETLAEHCYENVHLGEYNSSGGCNGFIALHILRSI